MLSVVLAHAGQPVAPHDVWQAWNTDPVVLLVLAVSAWAYRRGSARRGRRGDARAFWIGLAALAVALVSPLEALSSALLSAHMVQHVLLLVVAAPLLALGATGTTMLRGAPERLRRRVVKLGVGLGLRPHRLRPLLHPVAAWVLHVVVVWVWHSAALYQAALRHPAVHALEHATFLATALVLWHVILGTRARSQPHGASILLLFATATSGVLLSALLTFARAPWYPAYATTSSAWGRDPLADQQLAGVLMWVPPSAVYVVTALLLLSAWIRSSEREGIAP